MMTIEVKINGRLIAAAKVMNVGTLHGLTDYTVSVGETASDQTGLGDYSAQHTINAHRRRQSVWALIEKVARLARRDRERQDVPESAQEGRAG